RLLLPFLDPSTLSSILPLFPSPSTLSSFLSPKNHSSSLSIHKICFSTLTTAINLNGGEGRFVVLLSSGFVVLPYGHGRVVQNDVGGEEGQAAAGVDEGVVMSGCVVTIGFQILVNNLSVGKLAAHSMDTVNNLPLCTIQRIKDSLHLPITLSKEASVFFAAPSMRDEGSEFDLMA
ncbi:unnamed protein product, partial [Linum tenue]